MSSNYIELSENETEDYLKHMDRKIMFKDHGDKDRVSNGALLTPLYTLSSSHFWMKRNLISIIETGEYVYSSGCNIIVNNPKKDSQQILTIKSDCYPSSLYTQISSTGERLIIVGEKVRPQVFEKAPKNSNNNVAHPESDISSSYHGRVEIFNLDRKTMSERRVLDHAFYSNYDNFYL